jgi:hypothetical protein
MAAAALLEFKCVLYKMGNYHPILMEIVVQTKKRMSSSEITKTEA